MFDELGLSEKSPTNCLKVLHSKLEMSLDPNEQNQLSFIGISNWRLDAAKMNRAIFLAIPDIDLLDVGKTVEDEMVIRRPQPSHIRGVRRFMEHFHPT